MLFYPDFQIAVLLDRTLNELSQIDFTALGIFNIQSAATSSDGNIWIYNNLEGRLQKIDRTGKVLLESQNMPLLLRNEIHISTITQYENAIYLNADSLGILTFNVFGQFLRILDVGSITDFQLYNKQLLLYTKNDFLHSMSLEGSDVQRMQLPTHAVTQCRVYSSGLYVRSGGGSVCFGGGCN